LADPGEGKPVRDEVVYNIEPFHAAVRRGDWKLVWKVTLPASVELFNLAQDPSEKTNLADQNQQKVAELQQRIESLARETTPPLLFMQALGAAKGVLMNSVALPSEEKDLALEP
jgi:arylsulfatase A-like enzyme